MKTILSTVALLLLVEFGSFQECMGQVPSLAKQLHAQSLQHARGASRNARPRFWSRTSFSSGQARLRPQLKTPPPAATFRSATQFAAGGATIFRVVRADVNGDKLQDLVTVVQNPFSSTGAFLSVLLDSGSAAFGSPVATEVSFVANDFIIAADVNKDGLDDVILVHPSSMDILISLGDGTFAAPQTMTTGISSPIAAGFWDVNNDKSLDVVVVDGASHQAAYLLGNGQGSFAPPQGTSFPGQTTVAVLADVDLDGNLDLVTNDTLYPGDGSGGFLTGVVLQSNDAQNAGATSSDSVAVGDVNGDGLPDVVTANGYWNTVTVFSNHGSRQLVQDGASFWSGNVPVAVALADLNWDGKLDLIVTNAAQSDLSVFLGGSSGTFTAPTATYAMGGSPSTRAVLADFNGDGILDAVLADNQSSVVLTLGFGDGTFQAAAGANIVVSPGSNTLGGAISIASADFNGDGIPDFVAGQSSSSTALGLVVFLTKSDGSLNNGVAYAPSEALSFVAVGDFNKDGKSDLVASNWATAGIEVLRGNGDGTFQSPTNISLPGFSTGLVVADFNGDGWPDVALAGQDPVVYVLLNNGAGSLALAGTYPISGSGFKLVAADVNGDGKLDLCVAMTSTTQVAILLGNGNGTFSATPDYDTTLSEPFGIAAGDVDMDGRMDLVITSFSSGSIAVGFGNGDGSFLSPSIYPASLLYSQLNPFPAEVALSDVNEDGKLDIIYANSGYSSVGILLGDGGGSFFGPAEFPVGGGALAVAIADLNKDAWPDIVTADMQFSGVSVLYNTSASKPAPDFTVSASPSTLGVAPGGTGTTTISLQSTNALSGSVQLSCQNLPKALSCAFSPSVLHLTSGAKATSQLTITAANTDSTVIGSVQGFMLLGMIPVLGGFFFWRGPRAASKAALLALIASLMLFVGCQSLAPNKKSGQTYTVTVNALAWNGKSHSIQMQVTVQK